MIENGKSYEPKQTLIDLRTKDPQMAAMIEKHVLHMIGARGLLMYYAPDLTSVADRLTEDILYWVTFRDTGSKNLKGSPQNLVKWRERCKTIG